MLTNDRYEQILWKTRIQESALNHELMKIGQFISPAANHAYSLALIYSWNNKYIRCYFKLI